MQSYNSSSSTVEEKATFNKDQLNQLLNERNLSSSPFVPGAIQLEDDLDLHAAWAFKHIYSVPYAGYGRVRSDIARYCHGIQHVGRVAAYVPVFANLFRRYGDKEALALTQDDLKLIQIAALFHDAARKGEEYDYWDKQSGLMLYYYLTQVLKVTEEKAISFAEAIANKDAKSSYLNLQKNSAGEMIWQEAKTVPTKNIFQKLIHDADCLDIIRARNIYDAKYLDFYQEIANKNPAALDEMAQLVVEARSIIEYQGDGRGRSNPSIKKRYENENAFLEILASIYHLNLSLIPAMYAQNQLLSAEELQAPLPDTTPFDSTKELDETNLRAALRAGKVFARGMLTPSAFRLKEGREPETYAALEIRKMMRRLGTPTRTSKRDRNEKNGNPDRSVSMLGWGSGAFSNAGFLVVDPEVKDMVSALAVDSDSGFGKKRGVSQAMVMERFRGSTIEQRLTDLRLKYKMGGPEQPISAEFIYHHSEVILRLTKVDAIYWTPDIVFATPKPYVEYHKHASLLQAIFIQNEYEKIVGKRLPIFEYTRINNNVKYTPALLAEQIVEMWAEMCGDYLQRQISKVSSDETYAAAELKSLESLKKHAMYLDYSVKSKEPADSNYDPDLKLRINKAIESVKNTILEKHAQTILKKAMEEKISITDPSIYYFIKNTPTLIDTLKVQIVNNMDELLAKKYFDTNLLDEVGHGTSRGSDAADFIKLYEFLKQSEGKELKEANQKMALLVKQQISHIQAKPLDLFPSGSEWGRQKIMFLSKFTERFGLSEEFKADLQATANILFTEMLKSLNAVMKPVNVDYFIDMIEGFKKLSFVTSGQLAQVSKLLENYGKHLIQKGSAFDIRRYIYKANQYNLSKTFLKTVYLEWLKNSKHEFNFRFCEDQDEDLVRELEKVGLMQDHDVVLATIQRVRDNAKEVKFGAPTASGVEAYFYRLDDVRKRVVDRKFNAIQMQEIQQRVDIIAKNYCAAVLLLDNNVEQCKYATQEILRIHKSELGLKIPSCLVSFFKTIYGQFAGKEIELGWNLSDEVTQVSNIIQKAAIQPVASQLGLFAKEEKESSTVETPRCYEPPGYDQY